MMRAHVAIMKKSWGLLPKILTGEKTIESRWYLNRSRPWGKIASGDTVYFKNSGDTVTIKAKVSRVLTFDNLSSNKVREILKKYAKEDGIENMEKYYEMFKNKKYCILVFLQEPRKVKPFEINKAGFGAMSAWITVEDIGRVKV